MRAERTILHIVRTGSWPRALEPSAGDTVVIMGDPPTVPAGCPARVVPRAPAPGELLDLAFEHDTVVTW